MKRTISGKSALRTAVSMALATGMTLGTQGAVAQQEETALEQRVQVTGSRIKRVDVETTSPVTVVTSEQILASGLSNVGDVLRNLNQADSLGLSNLTSLTNANDGTQTISLRGLGAARTLVLVNGRRWLGLAGGQVDITQIPVALVERIEVLADGASAIYGSDAIAGVINIITRSDYDGLEVEMSMGASFEGDGETQGAGATLGLSGTRSSAYLNVSRSEQKPIFAGARAISEFPIQFVPEAAGSSFSEMGRFLVSCATTSHITAACPASGFRTVALGRANETPGLQPQDRLPTDFENLNAVHFFNFAPENYLLTPSDRLTTFAGGHFDVTDNVRAFAQFTFNQRKSETRIASVPLTVGLSGPQWVMNYSADNIYNPFGHDITQVGFRTTPLGPRTTIQDFDTYFGTVGFEGFMTFADRTIDWDVFYSRGESSRFERGINFVNLRNLSRAMGPSFIDAAGNRLCGTPGNIIAGCVPINFFNGISGVTTAMAEYIRGDLSQQSQSGVINWGVNFTGDLVDLPAGALAFAAGYEHRVNTFADIPDSLIIAGLNSTNFREPTSGGQTADELYVEFAVPLLRDMPLAEMLELTVAARRSDYENAGLVGLTSVEREFDNTSFKYALLYQPMNDLLIRGGFADTFRAPPVGQLFGGGSEAFNTVTDPCTNNPNLGNPYANLTAEQQARCHAAGVPIGGAPQATAQIRNLVGGNPFLDPEEGETMTLGVVYNPSWLPTFDVSIDYWKVELSDALSGQNPVTLVNACYRDVPADPSACAVIARAGDGRIETIRRGQGNLAALRIEGLDLNGNYRFDTDGMGSFALRVNASYTHEAKLTVGDLSTATNVVGRAEGAFAAPTWRWRGNISTDWQYGDFGVTWSVRYLSGLTENCSGLEGLGPDGVGIATRELCSDPTASGGTRRAGASAINDVGSVIYHDLSGSWRAPWNATVRLGLRNAFRKDPPFMVSPFANSFDQAYDIPGGFWFMSYRQAL